MENIHEKNINPDDILGLIFDSQGNCTIPIDQQGTPLMKGINWLDTRASTITHLYSEGRKSSFLNKSYRIFFFNYFLKISKSKKISVLC